jgi:hypothetical protein
MLMFTGGTKMKKLIFGGLFLALLIVVSIPTMARADVNVSIGLPPLIVFSSPPQLIVLPETYVYVVPDVDADIFFYDGWWWRQWEGRWYRSQYYDSGWAYYQSVPSFYVWIPSGWRNDYRDHRWKGNQWNYQRISHHQVQQNWKSWEKSKHWEKQQNWGVQGLKPGEAAKAESRKTFKPKSKEDKSKSRETVRTKSIEDKPKSKETVRTKSIEDKSKSRETVRTKSIEDKPKSKENKPKHSQQQQGNPEKGDGEKQDRR